MAIKAETAIAARVSAVLEDCGEVAVAVSGGVDSMTLAFLAHRTLGPRAIMFHAESPAVPPEAGARVRRHADRHGWDLRVVSAGEFADERYLANPVNRCYFCKTNLYGALQALIAECATGATIVSGANLDDLSDYRPGLQAAAEHGVRHPWVEAEVDKATVRMLAKSFGLGDLAELPAAPCLSSRLETGITVSAPALAFVHKVERLVSDALTPRTVRCRVRQDGVAVELDADSLTEIGAEGGASLRAAIAQASAEAGYGPRVRYESYRMGSAFRRS